MASKVRPDGATPAERPLTLLPVFVDVDKDNKELREQFLLEAAAGGPAALEGLASKLHKEMGLPEESKAQIQETLAGQARTFRDAPACGVAAAPALVKVQVMKQLDLEYVFVDNLDVDLNAPASEVDAYFAAVCRDLGLPHAMFVEIAKKAHAAIAAAREQVAAGSLAPRPAPDPGAAVLTAPIMFPIIVPKSKLAAAVAARRGTKAGSTGAAAPAPVRAEPGVPDVPAGLPAAQPACSGEPPGAS